MSLLRKPAVWLAAAAIYAALTFVVSMIAGISILPRIKLRIDLILHVIEYGILAWLILRYFRAVGWPLHWRSCAWITLLICAVVGGLNELLQTRIPGRFGDVNDMIANLVGAGLVIWWFRRRLKQALQKG